MVTWEVDPGGGGEGGVQGDTSTQVRLDTFSKVWAVLRLE